MSRFTTHLRENVLFESLTEEELSRLVPLCSDFAVVEEAILFREGRAASRLYLVTDGQIALRKAVRMPLGKRSRHTTVTVCQPGQVVGWSALVEPYRYHLSAVAWESSRLVSIDAKMMLKALNRFPELERKVLRALSLVASQTMGQMTETLGRELSYATMRR